MDFTVILHLVQIIAVATIPVVAPSLAGFLKAHAGAQRTKVFEQDVRNVILSVEHMVTSGQVGESAKIDMAFSLVGELWPAVHESRILHYVQAAFHEFKIYGTPIASSLLAALPSDAPQSTPIA
jgi:hypothetical protein